MTPLESLSDDARAALDDLFLWGVSYWGLQLEEKPHRWMCDELMSTLTMDEATPHLMLDVPRGCYKCQSQEEYEELSGRLCAVTDGERVIAACPTAVESGPVVDLVRVTTSSGRSMDVSTNHPFMEWTNWKSVDDGLKAGEWIAVVRRGVFGKVNDPALAELVGWMLADAHIRSQAVTVFDKVERLDLASLIEACGYTYATLTGDDGLRVHGMQDKWREWGLFHCKSKDKFVPEFILQGDEDTVRAALRGLSKDAYVSKRKNMVVYVTTSRRLARDYQHLLTKFGMHSSLAKMLDEDGVYTGIVGYEYYRVVFTDTVGVIGTAMELSGPSPTDLFPPQWRKRIPAGMGLKIRKAGIRIDNAYATSRSKVRRVAEVIGDGGLLAMCDGDIGWQQIKSIEPIGKGQIVHVESPTNTLATCDIVSHNTSLVTAGAVLQYLRQVYLYDNPYHRIVYASASLALGEAFLNLIENVLKAGGHEGRIDRDFGSLWQLPTFHSRRSSRQKDGIILSPRIERGEIAAVRDPNFFIASIRKPRVGFHADGAILDDLNDRDNVGTPDRLKKTQDFYRQLYPIIDTHDRAGNPSHIWMCATPWKDDDVRGMIIREEDEKKVENPDYVSPWRVVKATAHMEDGTLFFPTKLSEEKLASLKESMKSEYWAAYEGTPVTETDRLASEDQIRYKAREEFPPLRWCRITVDPNQHNDARKLGCYAAIVLGGYDQFSKLWIHDIKASRDWDTAGLIAALYGCQEEHAAWPIFVEDSHMTHFDHAVNLEYVRRMNEEERLQREDVSYQPRAVPRLRINWVSPHSGLSKYEKWQALKPRFQSGAIIFAKEIAPSIKSELENELTRGMAARFKDILDALAMMENGIVPRYKSTGKEEIVPAKADTGGTREPQLRTFAQTFPGMFR